MKNIVKGTGSLRVQLLRLFWQYGLLLLGLGIFLLDKYESWPSDVIAAVLLVVAAGKTGCFLFQNFRALAALRETFQRFLLLVSLNLGMIALSFALDFFCLYRIYPHAFSGLRSGTELDISGSWLI